LLLLSHGLHKSCDCHTSCPVVLVGDKDDGFFSVSVTRYLQIHASHVLASHCSLKGEQLWSLRSAHKVLLNKISPAAEQVCDIRLKGGEPSMKCALILGVSAKVGHLLFTSASWFMSISMQLGIDFLSNTKAASLFKKAAPGWELLRNTHHLFPDNSTYVTLVIKAQQLKRSVWPVVL